MHLFGRHLKTEQSILPIKNKGEVIYMETCRNISEVEYPAFQKILEDYLPDSPIDFVANMYVKYPKAYSGYFIDNQLVGICFGWPRCEQVFNDDSFMINGIVVATPFHAAGRGKKLITHFEDNVKELGFDRISVGSAEGYVEKFYMQNGYKPIEYKVLINDKPTYIRKLDSIDEYRKLGREQIINDVGGVYGFIVFDKDI